MNKSQPINTRLQWSCKKQRMRTKLISAWTRSAFFPFFLLAVNESNIKKSHHQFIRVEEFNRDLIEFRRFYISFIGAVKKPPQPLIFFIFTRSFPPFDIVLTKKSLGSLDFEWFSRRVLLNHSRSHVAKDWRKIFAIFIQLNLPTPSIIDSGESKWISAHLSSFINQ